MSTSENAARRVDLHEFRSNLTDILRQAHGGSTFVVISHDEVLAEIHPPSRPARPRRQPGALRGRIHMADDFDALPQEVLAAIEG